ncbi:glycogen synthase [Candidatus Parcubacteria bacterium]|nr:glycogen synthase [Candidatus Parcubacteria bacterium]
MSSKKLKIVSISSEIAPFSKSGGLADVASSLPKAIKRLGHDIICVTPLYGRVISKKKHNLKLIYKDVDVFLNSKDAVKINYWKGYLKRDLPVYFIENTKYFSKRKTLYMSSHENARFLIFNVAVLKLISLLKYEADIVHCHDWQTGLIPFYLKTDFRYSKTLRKAKSVFTIHNLIFQLGKNWWEVPVKKKDNGRKRIPHLSDPNIEYINFAKRAILSADVINTVSEQHRKEIITRHYGQALHRILRNREERLFGIINGIEPKLFNPVDDKSLYQQYNFKNFSKKKQENKKYIQKKFGLKVSVDTPLICTTSRITFQKGFGLIVDILEQLAYHDLQLIFIGAGDDNFIKPMKKIARRHKDKIVVIPSHEKNQKYETQCFAGSDLFLLPSHQEPCGINQMKAMRYGCIPIIRRVGGLHDTVDNFDPGTQKGTGFSFSRYNSMSLYAAIVRALETYKYKQSWNKLVKRAMIKSNSWEIPAKKYITLFRKAISLNGNNKKNGKSRK